ncbi:hypothetical protein ACGFIX_33840 [Nocardia salmonicida]|uniref:hypothetical protein n=1 Tax=Nocardia salmonicida TaxID=53431 RepID=UPI00371FC828
MGSLLYQILLESDESNRDVQILEEANRHWRTVRELLNRVDEIRVQLEAWNANPEAVTVQQLADLAVRGESKVVELSVSTKHFLDYIETIKAVDYIDPHPLSTKAVPVDWPWSEIVTARKTGLFAANLVRAAAEEVVYVRQASAFASGSLIGYATAAASKNYLNDVVGGPRRSHRYRHRLAENATDTWFRSRFAPETLGLDEVKSHLDSVIADAAVMDVLRGVVSTALRATYPECSQRQLPDLKEAAVRASRHIELLLGFDDLDPPTPPSLETEMKMEEAHLGTTSSALSTGHVAPPGSFSNTIESFENATWAEWVFGWPFLLIQEIVIKIVELLNALGVATGLIDPNSPQSQGQVEALVTGQEFIELIANLIELQNNLYESYCDLLDALKFAGLLYPSNVDLKGPLWSQFCSISRENTLFRLPSISVLAYPTTLIEEPHSLLSPLRYGDSPISVFSPNPRLLWTADSLGADLLAAFFKDDLQSIEENLNLDADRGYGHLCWRLDSEPGDTPLVVTLLGYDEF